MKYTQLPRATQYSYVAQCRTLVRALTTIDAQVTFKEIPAPARMIFDENHSRAVVEIDNRMPIQAITGLVIHEAGHVLGTDPKAYAKIAKKCEGESTHYINLVEDYRINVGVIGRHFPWAVQYIDETSAVLQAIAPHSTDSPSAMVNMLCHNVPIHDSTVDPKMLADAQQYLTTWGPSIVAAPNTGDLEKAALALEALDRKYGKVHKPTPQSEEEQARQEAVYGCAQEEIDKREAQAKAKGKASKPGQQEGEDEGEGESDSKPKRPKRSKASPYSACGQEERFSLDPAANQQAGFAAAIALLSSMRNRLHDAVVSDDRGAPTRHLKKGQLDCRRVAYATSTDAVFMAPLADRKKVNTAIDVVIDCSGSMDRCSRSDGVSRAHIAAATAYMLGSALARVDGAHVGVLLYDNSVKRMAPIVPMRGITKDKAAIWANAGGGTNTNLALDYSVRDLLAARAVRRRISLIITDDEAAQQENIDAAKRLGIEAYCLCIDSQKESTTNVKHCKNANELPGVVAELVKTMTAEGW